MPAPLPQTVHVALGARSYDVLIGRGLIADAGRLIEARLGQVGAAVVTDTNVSAHHLAPLVASFRGRLRGTIAVRPGEASKGFDTLAQVTNRLAELGIERGDVVIALGGGVVGDLAGFAAAILRRGVRFVQVPTTLLAQVDSSVGGKTGINLSAGKNLAGAFHQPALVLADTATLDTLPPREMRAGYAEVVKYGLLGDQAFYETLEREALSVLARDPAPLSSAIARSVAHKAAIVARDETETGDRMLLNLGHTFGHALEAWAGYSDRLLHGEAVAIGMAQAFRFSEAQGLCAPGTAIRVEAHLRAAGLPTRVKDIPSNSATPRHPTVDALLKLMAQDKKVSAGRLTFILARDIGKAFVTRDVDVNALAAFLADECR